jgi:hypothetical protein
LCPSEAIAPKPVTTTRRASETEFIPVKSS